MPYNNYWVILIQEWVCLVLRMTYGVKLWVSVGSRKGFLLVRNSYNFVNINNEHLVPLIRNGIWMHPAKKLHHM